MRRVKRMCTAVVLLIVFVCAKGGWAADQDQRAQSLEGQWHFELDRHDTGVSERWFTRDLKDHIQLPGILQGQGYGDDISVDTPWVAGLPRDMRWYLLPQYQAYTKAGHVKMPYLSQPPKHYLGVAWYQRNVEVPKGWDHKRCVLTLERTRWETSVYVDDQFCRTNDSLVAPHDFDLHTLAVGRHRLSVRIDNRMIHPYRPDGHSVSDALGSTWNGIVGKILLSATDQVWIEDAQVYPNLAKKSAKVLVSIGNATGKAESGTISVGATSVPVRWGAGGGRCQIEVALAKDAKIWSEFSPVVQHLTVKLSADQITDSVDVKFGLREIKTLGKQILLNGTVINLRMTHDGGCFPLTGYPATDVESWKRIIGICKTWGLNGIRFHSWCPPDAAFTAADELGFYLQPECGMWNAFDADHKMLDILNTETARLLKAYGNHPSFIMLAATNEPGGHYQEQLPIWDKRWRAEDNRHLYADGTGRPALPAAGQPYASDYITTVGPARGGRTRGPSGWFGNDYEALLRDIPIPALGHEVGQWCAYPDFSVIKKFTGYLQPGNYEIMRDSAQAHGLLEHNAQLAQASGKLQLACYKEEIEANLRTPSYSGIQLLDLHDYLGQGGALIGLLDAFWESKGYATPAEFKKFCNTTVLLTRMHRPLFTTAESLQCDVEVAHFGPAPLTNVQPRWRIENDQGAVLIKGDLACLDIPIGKNIHLGKINFNLAKVPAPSQLKLIVELADTEIENEWKLWVYPPKSNNDVPEKILITSDWSIAQQRLKGGGIVLFQPKNEDLDSKDIKVSTTPIFWNRLMGNGAATLGMWCDNKHPALANFPSAENCDWQWVNTIANARALNLDSLPRELQPIVQPIDDWNRNYKLGLLYECAVGSGRLMVSSIDLASDRPSNQALRRSILDYMNGDRFRPMINVSADELKKQWVSMRVGFVDRAATQSAAAPAPEVDAPSSINVPSTRR